MVLVLANGGNRPVSAIRPRTQPALSCCRCQTSLAMMMFSNSRQGLLLRQLDTSFVRAVQAASLRHCRTCLSALASLLRSAQPQAQKIDSSRLISLTLTMSLIPQLQPPKPASKEEWTKTVWCACQVPPRPQPGRIALLHALGVPHHHALHTAAFLNACTSLQLRPSSSS